MLKLKLSNNQIKFIEVEDLPDFLTYNNVLSIEEILPESTEKPETWETKDKTFTL